jgi:hypothetical protein
MAETSVVERSVMPDETERPTVYTGIYHELGKISAASESMIREMVSVKHEIKERTESILNRLEQHSESDDARFEPLEKMHAQFYAVIATVSAFWIVVTTIAVLWWTSKGGQ